MSFIGLAKVYIVSVILVVYNITQPPTTSKFQPKICIKGSTCIRVGINIYGNYNTTVRERERESTDGDSVVGVAEIMVCNFPLKIVPVSFIHPSPPHLYEQEPGSIPILLQPKQEEYYSNCILFCAPFRSNDTPTNKKSP